MRYFLVILFALSACGPLDTVDTDGGVGVDAGVDAGVSEGPPVDRSPGGPCDRGSTPAICRASQQYVDAG